MQKAHGEDCDAVEVEDASDEETLEEQQIYCVSNEICEENQEDSLPESRRGLATGSENATVAIGCEFDGKGSERTYKSPEQVHREVTGPVEFIAQEIVSGEIKIASVENFAEWQSLSLTEEAHKSPIVLDGPDAIQMGDHLTGPSPTRQNQFLDDPVNHLKIHVLNLATSSSSLARSVRELKKVKSFSPTVEGSESIDHIILSERQKIRLNKDAVAFFPRSYGSSSWIQDSEDCGADLSYNEEAFSEENYASDATTFSEFHQVDEDFEDDFTVHPPLRRNSTSNLVQLDPRNFSPPVTRSRGLKLYRRKNKLCSER